MDNSDQPNSIQHVDPLQMYSVPASEPGSPPPPFQLLAGEGVVHSGNSAYGSLVLTNYRVFLQLCDAQHHVPLGLLEFVEHRDLFYLHIICKDARTYRLTFDNNESCLEWYGRLMRASSPPAHLEELFAFFHFVWSKQEKLKPSMQRSLLYDEETFRGEVERLKFDVHGTWRISSANKNYKLCGSYPPYLLVPAYISDEALEVVAKFRSSSRIPTIVWRHVGNGAIIARCSQPEVGWLGWRSTEDEELIKAIAVACTQDRGAHTLYDTHSPPSCSSSNEETTHIQTNIDATEKKVLIIDARSYTTAVANRARGGGCECPEYYSSCEIQFMNLPNIHTIRKSFHALRQLCTSSADLPNWFSVLESTRWLQHMSLLMKSAVILATAVECDARPVLVHCSDGWDRTPQLVALAELLLDPYYRTMEGFRILIEREWLGFGHKFADRCGQSTGSDDPNERCPVFLQWLDCIHQLCRQFPCAFEFSHTFLVKLVQHTYSNLFGTFLCNTKQERERVSDTTFSVWLFLNTSKFKNHLYTPHSSAASGSNVLWPQANVRDLVLWSEVYLGSLELKPNITSSGEIAMLNGKQPTEEQECIVQHMTKTRSYNDLPLVSETNGRTRRRSDPNIVIETTKLGGLKTSEEVNAGGGVTETAGETVDGISSVATNGDDFLCDLDENDCKSDCIYKNAEEDDFLEEEDKTATMLDVIRKEKTDDASELGGGGAPERGVKLDADPFGYSSLGGSENGVIQTHSPDILLAEAACQYTSDTKGNVAAVCCSSDTSVCKDDEKCKTAYKQVDDVADLLYNVCLDKSAGSVTKNDDPDSDTECTTEPSDSRSENVTTVCSSTSVAANHVMPLKSVVAVKSVETSTETLVHSSSSKDLNGFEKLSTPDVFNGNAEYCRVCTNNLKFIHGKHSHSGNTSGKTSQYSTPPLYSRTPSTNGWDNTFMYCNGASATNSLSRQQYCAALDDDGLIPLRSDIQERLWFIIEENRRKMEALQRELQTYRQALISQVCHKCNHDPSERNDETSSIVDSVNSAGEGQASAVESLRSDLSWEALDEGTSHLQEEGLPTLWVPDHAVSRCTGCGTEFWLGRRRHHCRNCGRIFCADCSENSTPLPSEQLFDPVRVCTSCYAKLRRRECGEQLPPERCKHSAVLHSSCAAANNNPHQITASSN